MKRILEIILMIAVVVLSYICVQQQKEIKDLEMVLGQCEDRLYFGK